MRAATGDSLLEIGMNVIADTEEKNGPSLETIGMRILLEAVAQCREKGMEIPEMLAFADDERGEVATPFSDSRIARADNKLTTESPSRIARGGRFRW
jgi:hypothetical protein